MNGLLIEEMETTQQFVISIVLLTLKTGNGEHQQNKDKIVSTK